jgi:diguanylate cyclase (GGDEF)-like protein/PAS domain S-box-containing protein
MPNLSVFIAIAALGGFALGCLWSRWRNRGWRRLPDCLADGLLLIDRTGRVSWASDVARGLLGYTKALPRGLPVEDVIEGLPPQGGLAHGGEAARWSGRCTVHRADGDWVPADVIVVGRVGGETLWLVRDLSDQQVLGRLRAAEERHSASQRFANLGVWDWVVDTNDLYWSDEIFGMFGFRPGSVTPSYTLFCSMVHPDDAERVAEGERACIHDGQRHDEEYRVVWRDGTIRWLRETGDLILDADGRPSRMVGIVRDITDERETRGTLLEHGQDDPLTGLPNRARYHRHLCETLAAAQANWTTGAVLAVAFIDLDRFKPINDTHGHAVGDRVLQALAARMRDVIGAADMVARVGGDEFTLIMPNRESREEVRRHVQRVVDALCQPLTLDGEVHRVGASVGVALHPMDGRDADAMTRMADQAMSLAKRSGAAIAFHDEVRVRSG